MENTQRQDALEVNGDTGFLPLRVAGVDYNCLKTMGRMFGAYESVTDPVWSHYPDVVSELDPVMRREHEAVVSYAQLGLELPSTTDGGRPGGGSSRYRNRSASGQAAELRLLSHLQNAGRKFPDADYLTPGCLLQAVLECTEAKSSDAAKDIDADEDLASAWHGAPAVKKADVKAVLYMLRELWYQSLLGKGAAPCKPIALLGRPQHDVSPPVPYTANDPALDLGPTVPAQLRSVSLHRPMHAMALGASGTGKTYSVIVPRLKAHIGYRLGDGTRSAALVVDPKKELAGIAEQHLALLNGQDRLFIAGRHGRIRLFPQNTTLSLRDRVTLVLDELGVRAKGRGDSDTWVQKSMALMNGMVDAHAVVYNHTGRDLFADLMLAAGRQSSRSRGYWHALRDVIRLLQEGTHSVRWLHQRLMATAEALQARPDQRAAFQFLARYAAMDEECANQMGYVTGNLEHALAGLCDDSLSTWLDLSPVPEVQCDQEAGLYDMQSLIESSKVIVFQPVDSPSADVGTRLLKAQFYRAAMQRCDMRQPILFLCDEFQRFITLDRESGEASLLDRCRAYRITVVLATQSVTALYDALAKSGAAGGAEHAVDSILSNIAHMFYFQTPDRVSTACLKRALPAVMQRGWEHPLDVLPLSSLNVGEAYYIAPESSWGRTQFELCA